MRRLVLAAALAIALAGCSRPAPHRTDMHALLTAMQQWIDEIDPGHRYLLMAIDGTRHSPYGPPDPQVYVLMTSEWLVLGDDARVHIASKVENAWEDVLMADHDDVPLVLTDVDHHPLVTYGPAGKPDVVPDGP